VHRRVWIDNRTGRRLPGFPADPASAHPEVVEFWPSDMARIFQKAGLPRPEPPPLLASSTPRQTGNLDGPRILSPKTGCTYQMRLDRDTNGLLDLDAATEGAGDRIYWFVDSVYLGSSIANTPLPWKLQAGRHTIRAVDENGRADSRVVAVNAVE
jgi:penicillin-binding protein 1C